MEAPNFSARALMVDPAEQGLKLQILAVVLLAVLLFLHYLLWVDENGVRQTRTLRISIAVQKDNNVELSERNKGLEAEIKDLKDGLMAIEERARAEMGMIRPDETFYRLLEQPLPPPAIHKAAPPGKPGALIQKPPAPPAKPAPALTKPPAKPDAPPAKPKPAPSAGMP